MKKRVGLFLGLLALSVTLIACSDTSVEANVPDSFEVISKDEIGRAYVYQIKHKVTGCHYMLSDTFFKGVESAQVTTQMFIEKNGVSVPYCEGGN